MRECNAKCTATTGGGRDGRFNADVYFRPEGGPEASYCRSGGFVTHRPLDQEVCPVPDAFDQAVFDLVVRHSGLPRDIVDLDIDIRGDLHWNADDLESVLEDLKTVAGADVTNITMPHPGQASTLREVLEKAKSQGLRAKGQELRAKGQELRAKG